MRLLLLGDFVTAPLMLYRHAAETSEGATRPTLAKPDTHPAAPTGSDRDNEITFAAIIQNITG